MLILISQWNCDEPYTQSKTQHLCLSLHQNVMPLLLLTVFVSSLLSAGILSLNSDIKSTLARL